MTGTGKLTVAATPSAPPLLLRAWRHDDLAVLTRMGPDHALGRWTSFPVGDPEKIRQWLTVQHDGRATGDRISFAVQETGPDGAPVGGPVAHVALKLHQEDGTPVGEVGYWTAAHARGRAVATRALDVLCRWAVAQYPPARLARLELFHQVDNLASCRVAAKAHFPLVAVLPPRPPWPLPGHRHIRERPEDAARA